MSTKKKPKWFSIQSQRLGYQNVQSSRLYNAVESYTRIEALHIEAVLPIPVCEKMSMFQLTEHGNTSFMNTDRH